MDLFSKATCNPSFDADSHDYMYADLPHAHLSQPDEYIDLDLFGDVQEADNDEYLDICESEPWTVHIAVD
jgi:hypothetical protein